MSCPGCTFKNRNRTMSITVPIRNAHTRAAYYRAIQQFLAWCERASYEHLEDIEPITVAAYMGLR
jgi:hypothetical protein